MNKWRAVELKEPGQFEESLSIASDLIERRRQARFKLEVDITINSKSCGLVNGRTVDISETGISALVRLELPLGELVELDFTTPFGRVVMYAVVRQHSAFRYGFQFAESNFIADVIHPTCRVLAMEQSVSDGI
jgi:hypothetical protein